MEESIKRKCMRLTKDESERLIKLKNIVESYENVSRISGVSATVIKSASLRNYIVKENYIKIKKFINMTFEELKKNANEKIGMKIIGLDSKKKTNKNRINLKIGNRYHLNVIISGKSKQNINAILVEEYSNILVFDNGKYRFCISKNDLVNNECEIKTA